MPVVPAGEEVSKKEVTVGRRKPIIGICDELEKNDMGFSTKESLNEWLIDWLNEWMSEWMNEWMNEQTNERTNQWMNDWTDGWIN